VIDILSLAAAVLGISLLIVVHEAGHYLVARAFGMKVERFSVGFGPVLLSLKRGGTEFVISALPLGGYVRINGMAPGDDVDPADPSVYANQASWRRFLTILAGPAMNYVLALVAAVWLLTGPGLRTPDPSASVGRILPGSPAEQAGLLDGDRLLSVADRPVSIWGEMVREIQAHPGQEIPLVIERRAQGQADEPAPERAGGLGGPASSAPPPGVQRLTLRLTPRDEGGTGRAGFEQHLLYVKTAGLGSALSDGWQRTNAVAWSQVAVFGKLFSGDKGTRVSGPIEIVRQLFRAAREGIAAFASLLWIISIVLAVLNLLPLPALDGGRLVFLAYEVVTRRRVNAKIEGVVHLVGLLALIALLVGVTVFGDLGLGERLRHLGGR
jgi:regulator of sigma E protease